MPGLWPRAEPNTRMLNPAISLPTTKRALQLANVEIIRTPYAILDEQSVVFKLDAAVQRYLF